MILKNLLLGILVGVSLLSGCIQGDPGWTPQRIHLPDDDPCHAALCFPSTSSFLKKSGESQDPIVIHPIDDPFGGTDLAIREGILFMDLKSVPAEKTVRALLGWDLTSGELVSVLKDHDVLQGWAASEDRILIASSRDGDSLGRIDLQVLDVPAMRVAPVALTGTCHFSIGTYDGRYASVSMRSCRAADPTRYGVFDTETSRFTSYDDLLEPWKDGALASQVGLLDGSLYFVVRADGHYTTPRDVFKMDLATNTVVSLLEGIDWGPSRVTATDNGLLFEASRMLPDDNLESFIVLVPDDGRLPIPLKGNIPVPDGPDLLVVHEFKYPQPLWRLDPVSGQEDREPGDDWNTGMGLTAGSGWVAGVLQDASYPYSENWTVAQKAVYAWKSPQKSTASN